MAHDTDWHQLSARDLRNSNVNSGLRTPYSKLYNFYDAHASGTLLKGPTVCGKERKELDNFVLSLERKKNAYQDSPLSQEPGEPHFAMYASNPDE
jgi:hypothetical protein